MVRLATFNLMHGQSLQDGRVDVTRLCDAIARLDADVVALQEVDHAQPRSHHLDLAGEVARATGAQYRFATALFGTPGQDWRAAADGEPLLGGTPAEATPTSPDEAVPRYGIALLSRLPVSEWWSWRMAAIPVRSPLLLPRPGARPRLVLMRDEPRVVLAARVESPTGPLTVATTHLSFVPGWNVAQLRTACARIGDLPGPRVLLGDLNLPGALPGLASSGWRTLVRLATYPAHRPRLQIDHVMAERGVRDIPQVRHAQTVDTGISDHLALVVDLD